MKRKIIHLTESDLRKLISKIIEEQSVSTSFNQGKQMGMVQGQQARQAVNQAAIAVSKGMKETTITVGKFSFKVIIYGAVVVFLIGKTLFKIQQAAANAILKFLSATGKSVVKQYTQATQATLDSLKLAGIAIEKGSQYVGQQFASLRDQTVSVAKWSVNLFKQFGSQTFAKVLIAAAGIKEFSSMLGDFLKTSWSSIQNQIGVTWENASNWAKGAFKSAAQKVQNTASQLGQSVARGVQNTASQLGQSVAKGVGNVVGGIKGFLSEMYERYISFSTNTISILSEAKSYNGKLIL